MAAATTPVGAAVVATPVAAAAVATPVAAVAAAAPKPVPAAAVRGSRRREVYPQSGGQRWRSIPTEVEVVSCKL